MPESKLVPKSGLSVSDWDVGKAGHGTTKQHLGTTRRNHALFGFARGGRSVTMGAGSGLGVLERKGGGRKQVGIDHSPHETEPQVSVQ